MKNHLLKNIYWPIVRVCFHLSIPSNPGTCIPSTEADNGFSCECPDRFTGANCELHICIDGTCLISFPTDDGKNCTCIPQVSFIYIYMFLLPLALKHLKKTYTICL